MVIGSNAEKGATTMAMTATSDRNRAVQLAMVAKKAPAQWSNGKVFISRALLRRSSANLERGLCHRVSHLKRAQPKMMRRVEAFNSQAQSEGL